MKDENRRYLMVDATEMIKVLWLFERVFQFNDFDNIYFPCDDKVSFKEYFDKYNIPIEFQKIVLKTGYLDLHVEEFNTGYRFNIIKRNVVRENGKLFLQGIDYPLGGEDDFLQGTFSFKTPFKLYKYEEVMNFYGKLKDLGILEQYLNALKDAFTIEKERIYGHYGDKETIVR